MNMMKLGMPLLLVAGVACSTNPTVDPEADLTLQGEALSAGGAPLEGATVRLLRYFFPFNVNLTGGESLLEPSPTAIFNCNSTNWRTCGLPGIDFELARVTDDVQTDATGDYEFNFKGEDIISETSAIENQGSNLVVVVFDPDNAGAGAYSGDNILFSPGVTGLIVGDLQLWDASTAVDIVSSPGQAIFSWNRVPSASSSDFYRFQVGGQSSAILIINCRDDNAGAFDSCERNGDRLSVRVSLFSLWAFYSDAGVFSASVTSPERQRAIFTNPPPAPQEMRDPVGIGGVWAVSGSSVQSLDNTAATDGSPTSQEDLTGQPTEVYVQLNGDRIADAGLLNTTVANVAQACVSVEFTTSALMDDIETARMSAAGEWTQRGRFCGSGIDDNLSAIINFPDAQIAAWLRFRIETGAASHFTAIGEVAVFQP